MKIYEMILSMGIEEQKRVFYLENSIISRNDFLLKMKSIINDELNTLKKSQTDPDLIHFFEQIYHESMGYLEAMSSTFINHGIARLDEYLFMSIEEKLVVNLR
jgi:hypothetical protein